MRRVLLTGTLVCAAILFASRDAHAQYKNMSWGIGGGIGYWFPGENLVYYQQQNQITAMGGNGTTTIYDNGTPQGDRNPANQPLTSPSGTPFSRLNPMLRFEFNFKISDSFTWWFHSGLDIGIVRLVQDLDPVLGGGGAGGTALYLEVSAGPRVYFLTDEVRPFLEIGARIPIPGVIPFSKSNDFIPQNVKTFPGVYATFGVEFFVARDIALSIGATYTRFILFNFPGFNSLDGRFGVLFYM